MDQWLDSQLQLQKFSQQTTYIKQWVINNNKKKKDTYVDKQTIPQQEIIDEANKHNNLQSRNSQIRQKNQKSNIKKYNRKLQSLNRIQYPLQPQNFSEMQQRLLLPKLKIHQRRNLQDSINIKQMKARKNKIMDIIQSEFTKKKIQIIKRKKQDQYHQNIKGINLVISKVKSVPKVLSLKRSLRLDSIHHSKSKMIVQNEEDNQQIVNLLNKHNRKYSVPQLMKKINQYRY